MWWVQASSRGIRLINLFSNARLPSNQQHKRPDRISASCNISIRIGSRLYRAQLPERRVSEGRAPTRKNADSPARELNYSRASLIFTSPFWGSSQTQRRQQLICPVSDDSPLASRCEDTIASTADFSAGGSLSQPAITVCTSGSRAERFCEAPCESCFASS